LVVVYVMRCKWFLTVAGLFFFSLFFGCVHPYCISEILLVQMLGVICMYSICRKKSVWWVGYMEGHRCRTLTWPSL
jgi:hypothetical protein